MKLLVLSCILIVTASFLQAAAETDDAFDPDVGQTDQADNPEDEVIIEEPSSKQDQPESKYKESLEKSLEQLLEKIKNRIDSGKPIGKEYTKQDKGIDPELAGKAMDLLKPHKDDLGNLWKQIVQTTNAIVSFKESIGRYEEL